MRTLRRAVRGWSPGYMLACYGCPFRRREIFRHRVLVVATAISSALLLVGWASFAFGQTEEPQPNNPQVALALLAHRVGRIEGRVERMDGEHRSLGFMLLGTLVSSVTGLAVYIIKSPRREPAWDGVERRRPRLDEG